MSRPGIVSTLQARVMRGIQEAYPKYPPTTLPATREELRRLGDALGYEKLDEIVERTKSAQFYGMTLLLDDTYEDPDAYDWMLRAPVEEWLA